MRLFTLCSYLITKESYNWWITRREWGFRHQISEAKNLKYRLQIFGSTQEHITSVQDGWEISQPEGHHFAAKG